jgi:C_GCAxxG_C_C family probable redox protein
MVLAVGEERIEAFDATLSRVGTAFGGGLAGARDICGCVAGAAIIFGLAHGRTGPDQARRGSWKRTRRFCRQFEREFGSLDCSEITRGSPFRAAHERCAREVATRATELVLELLGAG